MLTRYLGLISLAAVAASTFSVLQMISTRYGYGRSMLHISSEDREIILKVNFRPRLFKYHTDHQYLACTIISAVLFHMQLGCQALSSPLLLYAYVRSPTSPKHTHNARYCLPLRPLEHSRHALPMPAYIQSMASLRSWLLYQHERIQLLQQRLHARQ